MKMGYYRKVSYDLKHTGITIYKDFLNQMKSNFNLGLLEN